MYKYVMRLDKYLFSVGLVNSRNKANELILSGKVIVNDLVCVKPSKDISDSDKVILSGDCKQFVSRGAFKLKGAIERFNIVIKDCVCLDIGSSTGGFTEVLLNLGAKKVYAVDVGEGQLDPYLLKDFRVASMENTDIRDLDKNSFAEEIDFVCVDVSFISITKILENIFNILKSGGEGVFLIKPQFEVGRENVGKGGVVKDDSLRMGALDKVKDEVVKSGFKIIGEIESPILGSEGNKEFLLYIKKL